MTKLTATFLRLCLVVVVMVVGVSVHVHGAEEEDDAMAPLCNCAVSDSVMDCSYRDCRQLPGGECPQHVKVLKMSGNGITEIVADYFKNCAIADIEEVYLDNNDIWRIDDSAFHGLEKVTIIDLSHNNIASLKVDHGHIPDLSDLSLAGNPLKAAKFPGDLKSLNLSSCQLLSGDSVLGSLRGLEKLTSLDLSSNSLTDWGEILELGTMMTRLESLHIAGNPWKCDCSLDANRTVLMKTLVEGDDPTCVSAETDSRYSLWEFPCPLPTTTTTTTSAAAVPVTSDTTAADVTTSETADVVTLTTNTTGGKNNVTNADQIEWFARIPSEASIYSVSGFLVLLVLVALGIELHARRVKERAGDYSLWWQDEDRVNGSAKYKYENIIEDDEEQEGDRGPE